MRTIETSDHVAVRRAIALVMLFAVHGCRGTAPVIGPLSGAPSAVALPRTALPAGHQTIWFRWEFRDRIFGAKGDGVARIAAPDSVRLDFFADGGIGNGAALLLGDSIFTPGGEEARRYLPSVPLLWAAFGTLHLVGGDTILRVDGDTLRADIVSDTLTAPPSLPASFWRVAFAGRTLVRLERVADRRLQEFVERPDTLRVRYRHHSARRSLGLTIQRQSRGTAFDPAIWQR